MARFYFDLHNGDGPMTDNEGIDLPSRESVTQHVTRILTDIARDEMPTEDQAVISIKVRDDVGKIVSVASLTFNNQWLD